MTKKCQNKKYEITQFIDENLPNEKKIWSANKKIESAKSLGLLSTEDLLISKKLDTKFTDGVVVITKNKRKDKKGDYFKTSNNQGIIKLSKIEEKKESVYVEKFNKMVKNKSKLLGAEITLTEDLVYYKKGKKKKILRYNQYI